MADARLAPRPPRLRDAAELARQVAAQQSDAAWREELLAMIWGPRFDREQAWRWFGDDSGQAAREWPVLARWADRFDALGPRRQQRLRGLLRVAGGEGQ